MIPPLAVHDIWPRVAPLLKKATDQSDGRYEVIDVLDAVLNDLQQLWIAFTEDGEIVGTLTTSIMIYPRRKMLAGHFLGGKDIMTWRGPMCDVIDKFAADSGCDGIEVTGRGGFERVLGPYGYTKEFTIFGKNLQ